MKTTVINPFESLKFWASKPLDVALSYLDQYAKGKAVLLDPFSGSGIFVYAALLRGMKAIYNDLSPYALFLARNVMRPVSPEIIQNALNDVLRRELEKDVESEKGAALRRGTKVEDAVNSFYTTTCDALDEKKGKCSREVVADYFLWDTEFEADKNTADDYANNKSLSGDRRYRIFLDTICTKTGSRYTFTSRDVNSKWKNAFDKDPKAWLEKRDRGKKEEGVINQVRATLVRAIFSRRKRHPILKRINCPTHGESTQPLNEEDYKKIQVIESLKLPWPDLIPDTPLSYDRNGKTVLFHQTRPAQIFVRESMSTIDEDDFKQRLPRFKHFFTKRNLLALNLLFWSIACVEDLEVREQLYLVFVSKLHMAAKFDRQGNFGRWATGYYASLDDFKENNVLSQMLNGWREIKIAKESVWQRTSDLQKCVFDETWDPREFLNSLNRKAECNVLWLKVDARTLDAYIGRKIVDVVFTDPPYRGEAESVQYFELTSFYASWLLMDENWKSRYGDMNWWKNEVIENEEQGKDMNSYYGMLRECFASANKIVKDLGTWIITYHSPNKEVWEGVRNVLIDSTGLRPPTYEQVQTHQIRAKGVGTFYVTRFASIGEDAYIVLKKEEGTPWLPAAEAGKLSEREFLELILKKMRREIVNNHGVTDWVAFQSHYPGVVLKHGNLFSDTKSYKDFFESVTIPLAGNARMFNRDKIGEDLYKAVYHKISPTTLLTRALSLCGEGRKEISRAEMEYKILPNIDGRVSNKTRARIVKRLFDYDPIGNKYVFKGRRTRTLEKWIPKPKRKIAAAPPMPEELSIKIVEAAKKYGGHTVKELRGDFQIVVEAARKKFLININDEGGVRRFGAGTSEQEKKSQIVVFLYYELNADQLATIATIVKPAILIAVPYAQYHHVVDALRKYDPIEELTSFEVKL